MTASATQSRLHAIASLKRTTCARRWKTPKSSASIASTNKLNATQKMSIHLRLRQTLPSAAIQVPEKEPSAQCRPKQQKEPQSHGTKNDFADSEKRTVDHCAACHPMQRIHQQALRGCIGSGVGDRPPTRGRRMH